MASSSIRLQVFLLGFGGIFGSLGLGWIAGEWLWATGLAGLLAILLVFAALSVRRVLANHAEQLENQHRRFEGEHAREVAAVRTELDEHMALHAAETAAEIAELNHAIAGMKVHVGEERSLVESLTIGISSLAEGDTSYRVTREFRGEDAKVKDDFNGAIERLSDVFIDIAVASGDIEGTAKKIADSAQDLSARVEDQAASLEETAAAMEEVTATIKNNADNAQQASKLATTMTDSAAGGTEAVNEAITAMAKIQRSAEEITQIVGMVDEIAFQTNLLALNAAVEAARAGEVGRGFAVVAAEVRALAQRSSEASRAIKTLINTSVGQVADGVKLVHRAGDRLGEIVGEIKKVNRLVADISLASTEQAQAIDDVKSAIHQLDGATQQNAHLAQVSNATSDNLLDQAGTLRRLISFFDTGGRDQHFIDLARDSADRIAQIFETALARGVIDEASLFDESYKPINGTNPPQVMTRFVGLTDRLLPAVQESLLQSDERVIFCCAVDQNGYLPTHNTKYSQPQGPDPVWNTANCRNRRIFNDVVGLAAGRSTKPYRLQTYQRDMGGGNFVLMKDVSAPIVVNGRHWGGFRIGFRN